MSPFESAALLSIDGWGEWSTTWSGHAAGDKIIQFEQSLFPNSLGVFYSVAIQFCGFKPNDDEGKTMGLAPCGNTKRFWDVVEPMVQVTDDLRVKLDLSWFDFPKFSGHLFNDSFLRKFGHNRCPGQKIEKRHADVATAFQAVLEKNILDIAQRLRDRTGEKNLAYAGGVSLDSIVNGLIINEGIFSKMSSSCHALGTTEPALGPLPSFTLLKPKNMNASDTDHPIWGAGIPIRKSSTHSTQLKSLTSVQTKFTESSPKRCIKDK